jgi:hypothetical protein
VPYGSRFKGYRSYIVQDLIMQVKTIEYKLEQWETPDGTYIAAQLPKDIGTDHFGPGIRQYVLFQHHSNRVPQNRLHEELQEMGINISAGQIDNILANAVAEFKPEKEAILDVGIHNSSYIQTDDTGARHAGKNGYCTVVGNDLFAYYASTSSKTRVNFLKILQGKNKDFVINEATIDYCKLHNFKGPLLNYVCSSSGRIFASDQEWEAFLAQYAMTVAQQKTLIEGALIGSLFHHGIPSDIALISDDAGQFNLFIHALCWAHAIRNIKKIIVADDCTAKEVEEVLKKMREYYKKLKAYSTAPSQEVKDSLWLEFDIIAAIDTDNPVLKKALQKFRDNKPELLRVLTYPFIPLTNNGSERDIRSYVIKRKISGGTRSNIGREARDTFTTLSTTCRKNKISFWSFLGDRIRKSNQIPLLSEIIRQKFHSNPAP